MSLEQNKAIVSRFFERLLNQEDKTALDEIFDADVIIHDPFVGTMRGTEAFLLLLAMFDRAFPGHRVTIDRMIAEGDCVTVLHTHTATHTGEFMGVAATGRQVVMDGLELFRLENGRIVEFWRKDDDVNLLMQLGIVAPPTIG